MNEIKQLKTLTESLELLETTLAKFAYQGDFEETHPNLPMEWSIYRDDSTRGDFEKYILDFTTNAPDGTYAVSYDYMGKIGRAVGVTVIGGAFDIEPTVKAVHKAVKRSGYWGSYIEGLNYNAKTGRFEASIGS